MMIFGILLLAVLVGAAFWYRQSLQSQSTAKDPAAAKNSAAKNNRRSAAAASASAGATKRSPIKKAAPSAALDDDGAHKYHAVSIQFKECACAAVKALAEKRFLTSAAPSIPLPACDKTRCQCSYAHHNDQRHEEDDRRSVHGLQTELYPQTTGRERRKRRGRRKTDF
jgi:hypothetical protein